MPLYQITGPDGNLYEIEGPEGATRQQVISAVQKRMSSQGDSDIESRLQKLRAEREELLKPKPTIGGNIKEAFKGIVPGAIGLAETAGTGLASLLPDDTEKAARAKIKEIAGIAKKPFEAAPGYEDSVTRKLSEGLGSTLPFFALGPLGLAGRVAAGGLGVAAGAGEAREAAEAKGATGSERATATALGAPTGLLDLLAPQIKAFKGLLTTAAARGGVEGLTEAAQKVAQNLIAKGVYDPSQPILVGSGEEGAYGAGVGALASLIVDMTIGRKARRAQLGLDKEPPETKAPGQQLLGYTPEPFTPVGLPDGSVITNKADYDKYVAEKQSVAGQRAEDIRTSDPLAELPAGQRAFARSGKQAALTEAFQSQEPDLFGELVPPRKEAAAVKEPAAQRDTQTRDMIDELESQQIEELQRADEETAARGTQEEARAKAEKERLKFESDLAELTGRVERKQEKTTEDNRLQLLLPIIEKGVSNVPKVFVQALKREGFTNPNLTERERSLINRVYDLRLAEEPVVEPIAAEPTTDAQKKELRTLESLVPEKKTQREPEQLGFPGIGKREAPQAFSEEELAGQQEKPFSTLLTADVLANAGLPKQSGFYKQLLNMDMADPAQQPTVAHIFGRVRENPNLSTSTKDAIERMAMQAFGGLAKQGNMFGPRGGVLEPTKTEEKKSQAKEKPNAPARASDDDGRVDAGGDRGGAGSGKADGKPGRTAAPADAKQPKETRPKGLVDTGKPAGGTGTGEAGKPASLKEKLQARMEKGAFGGTKTEAKTEPKTEAKTEAKAEPKTEKPKRTAQFGAYGQIAEVNRGKAIEYLAYDVYIAMFEKFKLLTKIGKLNEITAQLRKREVPEVAFGREGITTSTVPLSGGSYAKSFYASLSPTDIKAFVKNLEKYFTVSEAEVRRGTAQFTVQQELARATTEQFKEEKLELAKDAVVLSMPMHPAVRDALQAGDLREALRMVGTQGLGRASEVAKKLSTAIGKTKVEFESGLKDADGKPVAGLYDPKTDTIKLDPKDGLNLHTLLHESVHAATSHVLANKSHAVTKQLTELYNNVKDSLDTAYGAKSLDEFVAEAFSNPEFQQKLSTINPKGEAITAWQRFKHVIHNLVRSIMGKDTKGLTTALNASDLLVNQILSPAPDSRDVGALYSASLLGKGSAAFKSLDDRILSMPVMGNDIVGGIYELFREGIPSAVKKLVLRSLPLNALTEVATKDIPMAAKLDELEKRWSGAIDKRKRAAEATMQNIQNWVKGNPEKEAILNDVIANSTLEQVDPSKPRADYKGKQSESGIDKQKVWDDLQSQWSKLGPEGQNIYKQMRDSYAKTYEDLLNLLFNRIDASVSNKEDAKKLKTEIYQRLATKGRIEPYFPLTRAGDYRLSYDGKGRDGNVEHFVEHYETSVERERAVKELEKEGTAKNIQRFTGGSKKTYRDAPPTSFVNSLLRTLEANKVDPEVTDEVMRLFVSSLPESSFAQAFRKRKNTPGFSFDAPAAFYTRSIGMAHQLANLEYSSKMYQLRDEIDEHVKTNNNTERARDMADELTNHIQTLVSPNISPWSKALTSTAFGWTLGFNVSSAIVNMSQVPLVMMPYLGGKYGYSETAKAIGSATRLFFGSGLKRNAEMSVPTADGKSKIELSAGFSLDNYDFDAKGVPENIKRLKELSTVAEDYGLLSRSMTHDILDMDNKSTALNRVNAWSGFIFHHGERMNRQVSLIATYELELARMEKAGKKIDSAARTAAAEQAVKTSELMNGGASAGSAPLLAKNSLGKILFMYKRYGVSMYYMMFKTAREAMQSEDKEVRAAAMRQIAGIYASAGLMAGVQGIPMFGIMAAVYNLFKGDDEDDAETAARKYLGEGLFNGAVNYLTGTAVANRIGLSDLLISSTGYKEQDNAMLAFMQLIGGPVYGVADRIQQGVKLINEGETERGLERMLPAGIANGFKGIRFATEGANTLRGDPITGEMTPANVTAQFFGFAPAEYTRQLEINAFEKTKDRRATKERTRILQKYYISARSGDSEGMSDAVDDMLKFSAKHPTFAITAETVQNSMAQHQRTTQQMYNGVLFNKNMRNELIQDAAEFDGGLFSDE